MRILFDGHIFRWQKAGGISRYFTEIISRLPEDWTPTLLGLNEVNGNLPCHPRLKTSALSALRPRRFSQPLKRAWWKQCQIKSAQLLHPTYYTLTGGLRFSDFKCPVVITVHDFIQANFPHLEAESEATIRCQREAILRADHLICVSRATELDLLEHYPRAAGKTTVIYHGSSFPVTSAPPEIDPLESPKFLFVGRRGTYKNFLFLLRAFAKACQLHARIRLCVAGPTLTEDERWQIHFLGLTDRVEAWTLPDEPTLQRLYQSSAALLYPSRLEGFGIPPLEAMACGTLAVTSNTTSLPEVVGEAGILLDPADESAWAECILNVANDKLPRAELIQKGKQRAAVLSWEQSAQRHAEVYQRLSAGNRTSGLS